MADYVFKQLPTKVVKLIDADFEEEAYLEGFLIEHKELLQFSDEEDPDKIQILGRQLQIDKENRIDLLAVEIDGKDAYLRVIELKKIPAEQSAFDQIKRYIDIMQQKGWKEILKNFTNDNNVRITDYLSDFLLNHEIEHNHIELRGVLAAPEISDDVQAQLLNSEIQGIEIQRFQTENQDESFIFVDYHPAVKKWNKVEISRSEEFWKMYPTDKTTRDRIDQLLDALKVKYSFYVRYWQSKGGGIRVYSSPKAASIIAVFSPKQTGFDIEIRSWENKTRKYDKKSLSEKDNDKTIINKILDAKSTAPAKYN